MDALLTAFIAAGIAEWGDKSQLILAALAATSGRPRLAFIGFVLAAIASCAAAAAAGALIGDGLTARAASLLVALSLLYAGATGVMRPGKPSIGTGKTPLLFAAFILCLAAEVGDRTQFATFALAVRYDPPWLTAAGAAAGMIAAGLPAAMLGQRLQQTVPLRAIRLAGAGLFLITGFIVAVGALQLA